jgi:hypothetical protein
MRQMSFTDGMNFSPSPVKDGCDIMTAFKLEVVHCGDNKEIIHHLTPITKSTCEYCQTSRRFDIRNFDPALRKTLELHWPSCFQDELPNIDLWAFEWYRHGSCLSMTQNEYFELALRLFESAMPVHKLKQSRHQRSNMVNSSFCANAKDLSIVDPSQSRWKSFCDMDGDW